MPSLTSRERTVQATPSKQNLKKGKGKEKKRECEREGKGEGKGEERKERERRKNGESGTKSSSLSTPPHLDAFPSTAPSLDVARE